MRFTHLTLMLITSMFSACVNASDDDLEPGADEVEVEVGKGDGPSSAILGAWDNDADFGDSPTLDFVELRDDHTFVYFRIRECPLHEPRCEAGRAEGTFRLFRRADKHWVRFYDDAQVQLGRFRWEHHAPTDTLWMLEAADTSEEVHFGNLATRFVRAVPDRRSL